jgi:hypothetical protein
MRAQHPRSAPGPPRSCSRAGFQHHRGGQWYPADVVNMTTHHYQCAAKCCITQSDAAFCCMIRRSRVVGRWIIYAAKRCTRICRALRDHGSFRADRCGGDHAGAMTHIPGGTPARRIAAARTLVGDTRREAIESSAARRRGFERCGSSCARACSDDEPRAATTWRRRLACRAAFPVPAGQRRCRDCQFFARRDALQVSEKLARVAPEVAPRSCVDVGSRRDGWAA